MQATTILWEAIRIGLRRSSKRRGLALAVGSSIALAVCANTSVFVLANAALIRDMPVAQPAALAILRWEIPEGRPAPVRAYRGGMQRDGGRQSGLSFSYPALVHLRKDNLAFAAVSGVVDLGPFSVMVGDHTQIAQLQAVTTDFFQTLGITPLRGRTFLEDDSKESFGPVAVVSEAFSRRAFGGEDGALGARLLVNGRLVAVVGVAPPRFSGATLGVPSDIWVPLESLSSVVPEATAGGRFYAQNDSWWITIIARLRSGVQPGVAEERANVVFRQHALDDVGWGQGKLVIPTVGLEPGRRGVDRVGPDLKTSLMILSLVGVLIAIVTCANVTLVLLAQAATRSTEIAVRVALGARRRSLLLQLVAELLVVGVIGSVVGLAMAVGGSHLLASLLGQGGVLDTAIDARVALFAGAVGIAVFGGITVFPAIAGTSLMWSRELGNQLNPRWTARFLRTLLTAQLATAILLCTVAGLFVRSLITINGTERGLDERDLVLFATKGPGSAATRQSLLEGYQRMRDELAALPGVRTATFAAVPLLGNSSVSYPVEINGPGTVAATRPPTKVLPVGSEFFGTMGIPITLGRPIEARDTEAASLVAVANEAFVRRYLAGNPLGQEVVVGSRRIEIVGISRDAVYDRIRSELEPVLYVPLRQSQTRPTTAHFAVKTARSPEDIGSQARRIVAIAEPGAAVFDVRSQADQVREFLRPQRLLAWVAGSAAMLAILFTSLGTYGVAAYSVTRRVREIGIRMAMGAGVEDILRLVLNANAPLVALGISLGIGLAVALGQVAANRTTSILFGLAPDDGFTVALAVAFLVPTVVLGVLIQARRAATVSPSVALRCD